MSPLIISPKNIWRGVQESAQIRMSQSLDIGVECTEADLEFFHG